jgi:hypothetical protein
MATATTMEFKLNPNFNVGQQEHILLLGLGTIIPSWYWLILFVETW